jgi:hypothetical protein
MLDAILARDFGSEGFSGLTNKSAMAAQEITKVRIRDQRLQLLQLLFLDFSLQALFSSAVQPSHDSVVSLTRDRNTNLSEALSFPDDRASGVAVVGKPCQQVRGFGVVDLLSPQTDPDQKDRRCQK